MVAMVAVSISVSFVCETMKFVFEFDEIIKNASKHIVSLFLAFGPADVFL